MHVSTVTLFSILKNERQTFILNICCRHVYLKYKRNKLLLFIRLLCCFFWRYSDDESGENYEQKCKKYRNKLVQDEFKKRRVVSRLSQIIAT